MKKLFCVLIVLLVLQAFAVAESVYVTIADGQGSVVLARESIEAKDQDGDGVVSLYDALYAAHEAAYEGGAAAGFEGARTDYGISLNMLWGQANGSSYGYYVNNASAYSLLDAVKDGDSVYAFAYTDLENWSDTYSYFDFAVIETSADFALTLTAQTFDENWNPVAVPVSGAMITLNGEDTDIITDENGCAVIDIHEAGEYLISAHSDEMNLVPPVCVATIG